jgi:hypothetical protein
MAECAVILGFETPRAHPYTWEHAYIGWYHAERALAHGEALRALPTPAYIREWGKQFKKPSKRGRKP